MNKKIAIIACIILLVSIPLVNAVTQNKDLEEKESPLYKIRTKQAIREKISNTLKNIKAFADAYNHTKSKSIGDIENVLN